MYDLIRIDLLSSQRPVHILIDLFLDHIPRISKILTARVQSIDNIDIFSVCILFGRIQVHQSRRFLHRTEHLMYGVILFFPDILAGLNIRKCRQIQTALQMLQNIFHPFPETDLHIMVGNAVGHPKTGQRHHCHKYCQKHGYLQIHAVIEFSHMHASPDQVFLSIISYPRLFIKSFIRIPSI